MRQASRQGSRLCKLQQNKPFARMRQALRQALRQASRQASEASRQGETKKRQASRQASHTSCYFYLAMTSFLCVCVCVSAYAFVNQLACRSTSMHPWLNDGKILGLGMHLPVTSGLRQEVQLLLLCPNTYVDSSSPFSLQSARLSWSNSW